MMETSPEWMEATKRLFKWIWFFLPTLKQECVEQAHLRDQGACFHPPWVDTTAVVNRSQSGGAGGGALKISVLSQTPSRRL